MEEFERGLKIAWVVGAPEIEDVFEIAVLPGTDGEDKEKDASISAMVYDDGTKTLIAVHGQEISMLRPITRSILLSRLYIVLSLIMTISNR